MSSTITNKIINNIYLRNNRIRTKLLLFIDNEIRSKIKQNKINFNINYGEETQIRINFEETFSQKKTNNYEFSSSIVFKTKKNDNSDKTLSTADDSANIIRKVETFNKVDNCHNKIFNNFIFNKKIYSIKYISRQSSTFLILPKIKSGVEYLKTLCNNLKICKNAKKFAKHIRSNTNNKCKLLHLSKDKKVPKKSHEIDIQKFKKDNPYIYFLFRKSHKGNLVINLKH